MSKRTIICCITAGIFLFFLFRLSYIFFKSSNEGFLPQTVHIELKPPKNANTVVVDNIKGIVKKEGRKDTQFSAIQKPTTLVEGDELQTENGSVLLTFPNIIRATMQSNTEVDYLNGLPSALVVRQPKGTVSYTVFGSVQPFSIRSLGLLVQVTDKGSFTVATDADLQSVLVIVQSGVVNLAYSDANDTTQVITVTAGRRGFFDYNESMLVVR